MTVLGINQCFRIALTAVLEFMGWRMPFACIRGHSCAFALVVLFIIQFHYATCNSIFHGVSGTDGFDFFHAGAWEDV